MQKENTAILVVDVLNDFVTGALGCDRAKQVVEPIKKLVESAHKNHIPVFFLNDSHFPIDHELAFWGKHAMHGTKGAEVVPEIKINKDDFIIEKHTYSGFFGTSLDLTLRDLGIKNVILTGLHAHMCVRHTAADAYQLGYHIIAAKDAMNSFTLEDYENGINYLKNTYNAELLNVDQIIKCFEK